MEAKTENVKIHTFNGLRINIDGDWIIDDFLCLFNSINKLYNFYLIINRIELHFEESQRHEFVFTSRAEIPELIDERSKMRIKRL